MIMSFSPICFNSIVLSNGYSARFLFGGHHVNLKGVLCITGFQLDTEEPERHMSNQLLVETEYLGDEKQRPEQVIQSLEDAIEREVPFTKLVGVRKSIDQYLICAKRRVAQEAKHQEFLVKLAALEEEYKHVPPNIISMVKNFDHHYDYSDDINVYRRGVEREKVIKEELEKVGALAFFTRYKALL